MDNIRLILIDVDVDDDGNKLGEWIVSSDYDERLSDNEGMGIVLMSELPPEINKFIRDDANLKAMVLSNVFIPEEEELKTRKQEVEDD